MESQAQALPPRLPAPPRRGTLRTLLGMHPTLQLAKEVTPGRNAPCPCGSGRKFKGCCGRDKKA